MRTALQWLVIGCVAFALVACGGRRRAGDVVDDTDSSSDVSNDLDLGELPDGAECFDGTNQCSADSAGTEVCTNGMWTSGETCEFGCSNGACLTEAVDGSCATPTPLMFDTQVRGTTVGGLSANVWNDACTTSYGLAPDGPETVYTLEMAQAGAIEIDVLPVTGTYFGVYVRAACGDTNATQNGACNGSATSGAPFSVETVLSSGTWHIIVDDFGSNGDGPGEFDLTVREIPMPTCENQIPQVLDLSTGTATVMGDTANGSSSALWQTFACPASFDSNGAEMIYVVNLREPGQLRIIAEATEPADSLMGLYIRSDCGDKFSQTECGYADGMGGPASINAQFDAGTYYIFVDDFSTSLDETQTFTLTVDLL